MKKYLSFGILALAWLLFPAGSCSGSGDPDSPVVNPGGGSGSGSQPVPTATLGQPLPAWAEGMLDIHFINTTTGECTFLIFPDGTQMLIDAAGSLEKTGLVRANATVTNTGIRARWDPTRESGWRVGPFLADYIQSCMAWTGNPTLDYAVLTHFHNDHFGRVDALNGNEPVSKLSPTYVLQSFPEMLDTFPVGLLLDRGYPTYDYPFDMATKAGNAANCKNYITAVKWHVANKGLQAEKFKAGSRSQIVLKKKAADYPTFTVQNIAVNGEIWNGGTTTTATPTFPPLSEISVANPASVGNADKCPEENHCSIVMKISYGKFDYFAGGDAQYDGMSSGGCHESRPPWRHEHQRSRVRIVQNRQDRRGDEVPQTKMLDCKQLERRASAPDRVRRRSRLLPRNGHFHHQHLPGNDILRTLEPGERQQRPYRGARGPGRRHVLGLCAQRQ